MKYFIFLFLGMVLAFSVSPCCVGGDHCDDQAGIAQACGDHDDEGKLPCSPFFTCGTCVGFVFQMDYMSVLRMDFPVFEEKNDPYLTLFLEQSLLDSPLKPPRKA